jgi:hypothetical protein
MKHYHTPHLPHSESSNRFQEDMITKAVLLSLLWRGGLVYEVTFLSVYLPLWNLVYISKHLSPSQWHICKPLVSMCICIPPYGVHSSIEGWGTMLKAGRSWVRFPMRYLDFINLPNPSSHTMALGSTHPLTEMSTRHLPGCNGWLAHKADNLTAVFEPII